MFRRCVISLSNKITRWRKIRVAPAQLLLLVPRCLQNSDCELNLDKEMTRCKRCGICDIGELRNLCEQTGIRAHLASGGREALAALKEPDIKAVVAVACEKELCDGILASFPKPVLAVYNQLTNGPCCNTRVKIKDIHSAVTELCPDAAK